MQKSRTQGPESPCGRESPPDFRQKLFEAKVTSTDQSGSTFGGAPWSPVRGAADACSFSDRKSGWGLDVCDKKRSTSLSCSTSSNFKLPCHLSLHVLVETLDIDSSARNIRCKQPISRGASISTCPAGTERNSMDANKTKSHCRRTTCRVPRCQCRLLI